MPEFKVVVSDTETGKTIQMVVKDPKARSLVGRKLQEVISGDLIGLPGYELKITGGSDRDGFPIRPDVHGSVRKSLLLKEGPGIKTKDVRRRKYVRGNVITDDIVQINTIVVKKGKKSLSELVGLEEKEAAE
ncbi:MAG: 30S ribosomal protein S6e [Candidatus Odinarchaeia archaeon]